MLIDELADLVHLRVDVIGLPLDRVELAAHDVEHGLNPDGEFSEEIRITQRFRAITSRFNVVHAIYHATPAPRTLAALGTMISPMADDQPPGRGERIGAVLLVVLALGLLFVGADIISGGKLTGRGCGCDDSGT